MSIIFSFMKYYLLIPMNTDQRRMKVVEMGGAQELLNVLEGAKDDKTRKEVLKTLVELSKSGE